jgi:hypothetical protein
MWCRTRGCMSRSTASSERLVLATDVTSSEVWAIAMDARLNIPVQPRSSACRYIAEPMLSFPPRVSFSASCRPVARARSKRFRERAPASSDELATAPASWSLLTRTEVYAASRIDT